MPSLYYIVSDLHLEFFAPECPSLRSFVDYPVKSEGSTLLIAGDLGYPWLDNYKRFLQQASDAFEWVLLVAGNHEFYGDCKYHMDEIVEMIKILVKTWKNVKFLDNEIHQAADDEKTVIVGTTLWSPIPSDLERIVANAINDYRRISIGENWNLIKPKDVTAIYKKNVEWLEQQIAKHADKKVIILSHHLPSLTSLIDLKFKGSALNVAFGSDLETWMQQYPQIKVWCAGHTHSSFDVSIGGVRCIVNPRGYPRNPNDIENACFNPNLKFNL